MTTRDPVGEILIEERGAGESRFVGEVESGEREAVREFLPDRIDVKSFIDVVPSRDFNIKDLDSQVELSSAVGEQQGRTTLSFEIPRMEDIEPTSYLVPGNFVMVRAGYRDIGDDPGEPDVSKGIVFFGHLVRSTPFVRSPEKMWRVTARSHSAAFTDSVVARTFENDPFSVAFNEIYDSIGANIELPQSAEETNLRYYHSNKSVSKTSEELVQKLNKASGSTHFIHPAKGKADNYIMVNQDDPRVITVYTVDFEEDDVFSAEGSVDKQDNPGTVADSVGASQEATRQTQSEQQQLRYNATLPFDPRLHIGAYIRILDEGGWSGVMLAEQVEHSLGDRRWRTTISGPFARGNFFSEAESGPVQALDADRAGPLVSQLA